MRKRNILALVLACGLSAPLHADDAQVPYWASLRGRQVNMRVGPGEDYRINFVYKREHLPMKVLRTMEGWRLVQDPDGSRGWMLARFLQRDRGAIVAGKDLAEMHEAANGDSHLLWRLEPGVSGRLGDCADGWCKFEVDGRAGFVRQDALWGPGQP